MEGGSLINSYIRIFRKKVATVIWLILFSAATLFISVGGAFLFTAVKTLKSIERQYMTVAFPKAVETTLLSKKDGIRTYASPIMYAFSDEEIMSLSSDARVQMVDMRKYTAAYCGSFHALISAQTNQAYSNTYDQPYNKVFVKATILENSYREIEMKPGPDSPKIVSYESKADIKIEEVLLAHDGYQIAKGDILKISWNSFYPIESLIEGESYLIHGTYMANDLLENNFQTETNILPVINISDQLPISMDEDDGKGALTNREELLLYEVPTAVRLTKGITEFLAAPENILWSKAMMEWEITMHSLPMIGTESLESIYQFHQNNASIIEGSGFTEAEYEEGSKVCVISEGIAKSSGLSVGDLIDISQYACLDRAGQGMVNSMDSNPYITEYSENIGLPSDSEKFIVKGIYRLENWWDDGAYSFTPNTVFVPKKALALGARGIASGVFLSVLLKNGTADEFITNLTETGLEDRFVCLDQGYEEGIKGIRGMTQSAIKLFILSIICWLAVLCLFLVLYQDKERQNLRIMYALGTTEKQTVNYLFFSGTILLLAAVILGGIVGWLFMGSVEVLNQNKMNIVIWITGCILQYLISTGVLWHHAKRLARCCHT